MNKAINGSSTNSTLPKGPSGETKVKRNPMKLFVVASQLQAEALQPFFGDEWMVIGLGSPLLGHHFTHILVSESIMLMEPLPIGVTKEQRDSYIDQLFCRLTRNRDRDNFRYC